MLESNEYLSWIWQENGGTDGERKTKRSVANGNGERMGDPDCARPVRGGERNGERSGYDEIVLVIGRLVRRDPPGQRSRGKVLFNGIVRPSTMLIPLGTRSLLGRLGH